MKHYIYLSDTKIDMLFSQVPKSILSSIKGDVKFAFGVFEADFSLGRREAPDRYSKLAAVLAHLHRRNEIGTVMKPSLYFYGTQHMKWGEYEESGFIYFTGRCDDTILGLGGSLKHVLGSTPVVPLARSSWGSRAVGIERSLAEELKLAPLVARVEDTFSQSADEDSNWEISYLVGTAYKLIDAPRAIVDFVALKLLEGCFENRKVLLGTPLYVAYAP